MSVDYCGDGFCVPEKPNIDASCHALGQKAGKWIMYQVNGKTCYCICSCVGEGTMVTDGHGEEIPVEAIEQGQTTVLAAGRSLEFKPKIVESIVGTAVAETENTIYLKYILDGVEIERVVTMDHPFLLADGNLVGAGVLQLKDRLVDDNGNEVEIKEVRWGTYVGQFFEFATSLEKPNADLEGHLVLTDGVVTGDYAVSVYVNFPINADETKDLADNGRPFIGSAEWREKNGMDPASGSLGVLRLANGVFIPAEHFHVDVPEHASAFLPEWQANALERKAKKLPLSDQYRLDMCEFILNNLFATNYPDIQFEFNWYDDDINSYSWVDTLSGDQKVYLSGGLARVEGFDIDGVTLAIAHEVGHLLGKPQFEDGVTCEGQADWFGASIVLRSVWFGVEYFSKLDEAIAQMRTLYRYLRKKGDTVEDEAFDVDHMGQPYPSNECRLKTFEAAKVSPTAPECSLCAEPEPPYDDDEDDEDEGLLIDDGSWLFEAEEDPETGTTMAKFTGVRDRQRRKKRRLPAAAEGEDLLAKISGARDRQRRKKHRFEEEDGGEDLLAKISGARDRQRRKKRRFEEEDGGEDLLAKISGARDRQRRKKRRMEDDEGGNVEGPFAKIAGPRDRQRKKKYRLVEVFGEEDGSEDALLGKGAGARDRQRKKKGGRPTKKLGGNDRQRRKKR
ncbi:hypothetical protein [Thalassococcus sp. S3]|uniref:hypothetical protein n=1 Tax=Thalassococcus sp. S3 TaxID=2017482 RepID=UPI0015835946|nr:hypothetical protein [Thalassococcus sp. S3]